MSLQSTFHARDPLLLTAKIMAVVLMALTAVVGMVLLGTIPVLLFNPGDFATAVAEAGGSGTGSPLAAAVALLLLGAAVTLSAFYFFRLLARLIDSVGQNDPFTAENADRLRRMGWVALAFQLASFPIAALVVYLGDLVPLANLEVDFDFSLTGLLLAVVLFVLARVFRLGAAMREDLEGTV